MRNLVNFALLGAFTILIASALLSFFAPFDLLTTRVHIVFGTLVLVLVGLHLVERLRYFRQMLRRPKGDGPRGRGLRLVVLPGVLCGYLLAACVWNWPPVPQLIATGYEARHRAIIFRPERDAVARPVDEGMQMKRRVDEAVGVMVEVDWGEAMTRYMREAGDGGEAQVAIWAESSTGSLIETFFVSEASAFSEELDWGGQKMRRVEVLPIWRHRFTLASGVEPSGEIDSFSSATPEHSFSVERYLVDDPAGFYVCVEVNIPNDENAVYRADHDEAHERYARPGLGQPSVLYSAYFDPESANRYALLELIGHGGGSNQQDGHVRYDLDGLTTARGLIEKVLVRVDR